MCWQVLVPCVCVCIIIRNSAHVRTIQIPLDVHVRFSNCGSVVLHTWPGKEAIIVKTWLIVMPHVKVQEAQDITSEQACSYVFIQENSKTLQ